MQELESIYQKLCKYVSEMEAGFVHEDETEFYNALSEVDNHLDLLREFIQG